jgi:hypothetical protein
MQPLGSSSPAHIVTSIERHEPYTVPDTLDLATATEQSAETLFNNVADAYLEFRRVYYREASPSLATVPPASNGVQQAHVAQLAENTLRVIPSSVKAVPLLGGLLEHLQQVANIYSMSETERTTLHNLTMLYLHGVNHGLQPWYVNWYLASAQQLSRVNHPDYFIEHPWDALFYLPPRDLTRFEEGVHTGDVAVITDCMHALAQRLIAALKEPIEVQSQLAFTGPGGDERRAAFQLKTTAALGFGAYLIWEEAHTILRPKSREDPTPASQLAALPPETESLMTDSR